MDEQKVMTGLARFLRSPVGKEFIRRGGEVTCLCGFEMDSEAEVTHHLQSADAYYKHENRNMAQPIEEAKPPVPAAPTSAEVAPKLTGIKVWVTKITQHRAVVRVVLVVLAGLIAVPYLAYRHMLDRLERETNLQTSVIDARVPELKLETSAKLNQGVVIYEDGTRTDVDAFGLLMMTWDDYKEAPERFNGTAVVWQKEMFPVLAYFNASGFDSTGNPVMIRSTKDGKVLFQAATKVDPLKLVIVQRDGTLKVLRMTGEWLSVTQDEWHKRYMAQGDLLPPDKLAALPDDKLKELGYVRVGKNSSGIYGHVIRVGGNVQAVEQVAGAVVKVFAGKASPGSKENKLTQTLTTAKDGTFTAELAPGEYTLVIDEGGKLYGNAFDQTNWPPVTVEASKWIEYEFRRTP